jgi:DNA-binding LytR/AlgR family response regulator
LTDPRTRESPAKADSRPPPRDVARAWFRLIAVTGVVGAILAASGNFGAGGLTTISHLAFWLAVSAVGATIGVLIGVYVIPQPWFARRPRAAYAVIVLALWAPMSLVVALVNSWAGHRALTPALVWEVAPSTLATTAALTALAFLVRRRDPVETHAAAADAPPPKFLERLPARLAGAELWAVEAEDHYLRLHTSRGQDLILLRLGDAIGELEGIEGARTHRSWWVARAAVRGVERDDGRATLALPDGVTAPVSRAYAKALRAHGWF